MAIPNASHLWSLYRLASAAIAIATSMLGEEKKTQHLSLSKTLNPLTHICLAIHFVLLVLDNLTFDPPHRRTRMNVCNNRPNISDLYRCERDDVK